MVSATDSVAYRKHVLMRISSPGRFFAAFELKAMLAYAILHYDLKLEGTTRPANRWYALSIFPPSDARLLVKRRVLDPKL